MIAILEKHHSNHLRVAVQAEGIVDLDQVECRVLQISAQDGALVVIHRPIGARAHIAVAADESPAVRCMRI